MRAAALVLVLLVSPAFASAIRIDLKKSNQATSPLKYTITTMVSSGLVTLHLEVPRKQKPLDHLWRIDISLKKGNKTLLAAPLEMKLDGDVLKTDVILDPATMPSAEIWIRTGPNAPRAETIYAIDVGSFK